MVPTFFSGFSITSPMKLGRASMGWVGLGWAGRWVSYGNFVNLIDGGAIYIIPLFNFNTPLSLFD
jgi:hypothetical protein